MKETADINTGNNSWPKVPNEPSKLQAFKLKQSATRGQSTGITPMQKAEEKKKKGF
jgi:hypothetical protein